MSSTELMAFSSVPFRSGSTVLGTELTQTAISSVPKTVDPLRKGTELKAISSVLDSFGLEMSISSVLGSPP